MSGIESGKTKSSSEYTDAEESLEFGCGLFILGLLLEFISLVCGFAIFFNKVGIAEIIFHIFGCIFCYYFLKNEWHYESIYEIWGLTGVGPFILEIISLIYLCVHKKTIKVK